jgi:hypothetical protein
MSAPPTTPSAAQLHAWRELWRRLLAPCPDDTTDDNEMTPAGGPTTTKEPPTGAQCDDSRAPTPEPPRGVYHERAQRPL